MRMAGWTSGRREGFIPEDISGYGQGRAKAGRGLIWIDFFYILARFVEMEDGGRR